MEARKKTTEQKIKEILGKHLAIPAEEIGNKDSFTHDLNADPRDLAEAFEEVYAVFKIEEHRTGFSTVAELVDYVKDHLDELEA